jgi:hypothetical protein
MAFTETQAITQVRYLLNEPTASFWTDSEIQGWVQQAVLDISCKTLCTTDTGTITVVQDQMLYTSSDESWIDTLLKVEAMWYGNLNATKGMQRTEPYRFGHLQVGTGANATPRYFYEDGKRIYLWPVPATANNGDTINVVYSKLTFDITELREEYQQLTFWYAASMAKAKDRKFQEASLYQQLYLNALNFERQDKYTMGALPTDAFKQP